MLKEYWIDGEPSTKNEFETIFKNRIQAVYYAKYDRFVDDHFPAVQLPFGWGQICMSTLLINTNREKYGREQTEYSVAQARDYINTMFMFSNFDLTIYNTHFQYKETED